MINRQNTANRRQMLIYGLGVTGLLLPSVSVGQNRFKDNPFLFGVASGDPASDGFVIWTRLGLEPLAAHSGMPMERIPVTWELAEDEGFSKIIQKGETLAHPELGHSVHVEIFGLKPARPYWYRFTSGGAQSPAGRAITAPLAGAALDRVRFAVAGCQKYEEGYYSGFKHIAQEDIDFLFHYGDYIYEYSAPSAGEAVRDIVGDQLMSLDDYRRRYSLYKLDPDLQAAHAHCPWFVTMDDHEVQDNWAGQFDKAETPPEYFLLRRQAAFQAYYENMPLRKSSLPHGPDMRLYRQRLYGDLLNANFMDTRQYRTDQPCGDSYKLAYCQGAFDRKAQIINADEEKWLKNSLHHSKATWNLMAQQVMMMPMDRRNSADDGDVPLMNLDSWAGYPVARQRMVDALKGLNNVVVLTGDEHQNFAGEILSKGREGQAYGVEFVVTSISSEGDGQDEREGTDILKRHNPQLKFENDQRGYMICDVNHKVFTSHFRVLDYVSQPNSPVRTRASFAIEPGQPKLQSA